MSGLVVPLAMLLMRNSQYPFGIGPYAMEKPPGREDLLVFFPSTGQRLVSDKAMLPVTPNGEQSICLQYSQCPIERNCLILSGLRYFNDREVPRISLASVFSCESIWIL